MSSQRLEGSDLEALLARVRSEYGEQATIVEANKVRRGGVAGFFAKESFEVVLDLDQEGAADDGEPPEEPFVPFSLEELASSVDDPAPTFDTPAPEQPVPGTAARRSAPLRSPRAVKAQYAEASATDHDEVLAEEGPTFSEVLGRAIAAERAAALEPAWPATAAVADAYPAARIVAPRHEPGGLAGVAAPAGGLSAADLLALRRLGLPTDQAALLARSDDPAAVALVRLLESFPVAAAMPSAARSVLAVVGDRDGALEVAAAVAERLTGEARVLTASRRRGADLRAGADVVDLLGRSRRRRHPVVVAVDAPFAVTPSAWATELLDALEPSMVLGHVDAGRKPEDVLAWSGAVGGIDALAVTGLAGTTTPAAVLATGIPVASLDGAPATPARWAALLTDRLTAALAA